MIGDEVTELDVPAGVAGVYGNTAQGPLFTTEDGRRWFRMGPDGVLVETDRTDRRWISRSATNGDTEFVQTTPDGACLGSLLDTGVGASTAGGPWVYTDWSNLPGEGPARRSRCRPA